MRSLFAGNLACCLRVFDAELDVLQPVWRSVAGAGAGAIATVLTYPLDLVRAKLAVHDVAKNGPSPGVAGTIRAMVAKEGASALFKGARPSLVAVAPFVAIQQASYDTIKQACFSAGVQPSVPLFLGCGALAGATAQTIIHPMDVVRRRIQVSPAGGHAHWTTMMVTLQKQGTSTLFAGLLPAVLKIAPAVAISLLVRDSILGRLDVS